MWSLLNAILESIGLSCTAHARLAKATFLQKHPSWRVLGAETQAREHQRYVVAVFYERPDIISFPPQYKLYGITRDLSCVEELFGNEARPYQLRDYK